MPKYYCDYCDIFLTHDSSSVRKAHNAGRNHLINVRTYYNELSQQTTQEVVNTITKAYADSGAVMPAKYSGYPQPFPVPGGGFNPYGRPNSFPGMPPGMPGMPPLRLGLDGPNGLPPRPPPPMFLRPGAGGPPPPGVPGLPGAPPMGLPPGMGGPPPPGTAGAPFPPPGFPAGAPFPPPGMPPFMPPPGLAGAPPGTAAPFPPGQFPPPHFAPGSIPPPSSAPGPGPVMNSDRKRRLEEGRD
ncbi:U1 zinc finger-domain-containing protein [Linnemannia elongata]|nr:U1 zinc finger-domain-containing protein [Linnemannia elongata]